jgi:hypothetical protein
VAVLTVHDQRKEIAAQAKQLREAKQLSEVKELKQKLAGADSDCPPAFHG